MISEYSPERVLMRVPRQNVASAASSILNSFDVADLTIEEVPIEEIIRKIC